MESKGDLTLNQYKEILNMLEFAYTGARANNDLDIMVRISRAIKAFELDTNKDCIITIKELNDNDMA